MRREAEQEMYDLCDKLNNEFKLVKFFKKEGQDVNGGCCLRETNGKFAFSENDQKNKWKKHTKKMTNKKNAWDQYIEIGIVEGLWKRFL